MEPMDGFSVAEAIGKSGYRTKIIFVTSHEDVVYDTFDILRSIYQKVKI